MSGKPDAVPAHERFLGIKLDSYANGQTRFAFRMSHTYTVLSLVTEDELLAAADSLRALVETARKERT